MPGDPRNHCSRNTVFSLHSLRDTVRSIVDVCTAIVRNSQHKWAWPNSLVTRNPVLWWLSVLYTTGACRLIFTPSIHCLDAYMLPIIWAESAEQKRVCVVYSRKGAKVQLAAAAANLKLRVTVAETIAAAAAANGKQKLTDPIVQLKKLFFKINCAVQLNRVCSWTDVNCASYHSEMRSG